MRRFSRDDTIFSLKVLITKGNRFVQKNSPSSQIRGGAAFQAADEFLFFLPSLEEVHIVSSQAVHYLITQ
ncbi:MULTISPECIES: hypothetical protein [Priestia]|uniref:hypothetical protein n=1 Tax=Priestia TaxID=2800373 RepID=UPI001F220AC3|nr:hypothetical protein [Priestia megaterium]MDN3230712.1 hypothetical protein [Priestia megaterium]